jgi:hypothetical protein
MDLIPYAYDGLLRRRPGALNRGRDPAISPILRRPSVGALACFGIKMRRRMDLSTSPTQASSTSTDAASLESK